MVVDFPRMQRSSSSPSYGSSSDATKRRLSVASILNNEQGSIATPLSATTMGSGQRRGETSKPEHHPSSMPHYPMSSPQYQPQSPLTTTEPVTRFHRPSAYHQMSTPYATSATNPNSPQVGSSSQSGETGPSGLSQSPITLDYGPPSSVLVFRRAPLTSESQRRELLENDPWSDRSQLTPHSVYCRGCGRTLALDKNPARKYYPGHWKHHRSRCTAIQIRKETLGLPQEDGYWDSFATQ
ncbi:hypothetical protein E1B28_010065 [Marasmius oreades]|uniref:Uncharacterized protein n=1 Tax=Marasmius oreades TaxID=181124 RepID=A0A9P7RWZ7_9AGAR|nr:uncharacterized protein E1B28_010065 [Marasmius oreades]KAG7090998.1 hypothetical protein E1B28_010065 [Marasmius oreades]